jgi:capsular exopolysaccharide synthesis family protein
MIQSILKRRRDRRCRLNQGFALVVDRMEAGLIKEAGERHATPLSWEDTLYDSDREELQAFRQLRDRLLMRSQGAGLRTLAVCKASPGEGSSRVACHLAMAFASDPRVRVALVDSDFHHPGLHGYLQVRQANGLYDTLHDGAETVKERIKTTAWPNLAVVTSGEPPASRAFPVDPLDVGRILQQLLSQFSMVIVDTAPVLVDSTAAAVASQCDGSILVVQAEQTRREAVQETQARLQQAGAHLLGAVLNKRQFPIPECLYKRL